jgi:hypothetical protein
MLASEGVPQRRLREACCVGLTVRPWNCNITGGEQMLTRIRALVRRVPAWRRRRARQGADPLLASDAERARARAAADYHNRVGDPGHFGGGHSGGM